MEIVIESLLLKKNCPSVNDCCFTMTNFIKKIAHSQCLSFMILNVNTYANVVLERSLRTKEGRIGVKESILTMMKQI